MMLLLLLAENVSAEVADLAPICYVLHFLPVSYIFKCQDHTVGKVFTCDFQLENVLLLRNVWTAEPRMYFQPTKSI
jgi:hypothetical protein